MGTFIFRCLLLFLFATLITSTTLDEDDTVVIEAAEDSNERSSRHVIFRQQAFPLYQQSFLNEASDLSSEHVIASGPCINSKGQLGKCMAFRKCYPYFKLPELNNWDTWVLGMYDTCSYYTAQGRQMFGVCCSSSVIKPEDVSTEAPVTEPVEIETTKKPNKLEGAKIPQYPNWPPPLPTHPPDHTIPPLPTHPSSGFPGTTKPSYKPTPKPPKKPGHWSTQGSYKPRPTTKPTSAPISNPPVSAECGAKNGFQEQERIVGGHNADKYEWPWIAALFNGGRQFCGGSLIDNIHILSAAHCVAHMSSWDVARLTVRLADHDIKSNSEVKHIEKRVKRVVRHKGFDPRTLYNDIAILTLDSPVQFSTQVKPICLPQSNEAYSGKTATVIGWGSLREMGPQPAVLQEVNIPIWKNTECRNKYGHAAPGGIVEHMICAGQATKDSCSGDSGGPLMVNTGRWTQVGIVSWGIGCGKGQYPGVYTRITHFKAWIEKNLK